MRTLTAGIEAAKNTLLNIAPVWVLDVGGTFMSTRAITFSTWEGGLTTNAWVQSFGAIEESLGLGVNEIYAGELTVSCIRTDDITNIEDIVLSDSIEGLLCKLYFWVEGQDETTDPPVEVFRGYITDPRIPADGLVTFTIEDESAKLNVSVGTIVSQEDYPDADPDDIGKLMPIPYGQVTRVPTLALVAGAVTNLGASMDSTQVVAYVTDSSRLAVGDVVTVDSEEMYISAIPAAGQLTVTRGYNSTVAIEHSKAAALWEALTEFIYLASEVPITSFDKITGKVGDSELDITSICTLYTGQAGDEHASYPGKAIISAPGYITVAQAVDLIVSDSLAAARTGSILKDGTVSKSGLASKTGSVTTTSHIHTGSLLTTAIRPDAWYYGTGTVNWTVPDAVIDGNLETGGAGGGGSTGKYLRLKRVMNASVVGTPTRIRAVCYAGDASLAGTITMTLYLNGVAKNNTTVGGATEVTHYGAWATFTSWASILTAEISLGGGTGLNARIWEGWFEVEYDSANAATTQPVTDGIGVSDTITVSETIGITDTMDVELTGAVTLSGNSTANTLVGDLVLADMTRSLSSPAEVIGDLLSTYGGISTLNVSGTFPTSYVLSGVIADERTLLEWIVHIALQCKSYFKMGEGEGNLIVRGNVTADKTINRCLLDGSNARMLRREKTMYKELFNRVMIKYDIDLVLDAPRKVKQVDDTTSQTLHGVQSSEDTFYFPFVIDDDHASDLATFYLARYKDRHWIDTITTSLENLEVEFADILDLQVLEGQDAEVVSMGISPGGAGALDTVYIRCKEL